MALHAAPCGSIQCADCYTLNRSVRVLICSGCGERYLSNDIEGKFHDHWTTAGPTEVQA